ncbi:EF-hand domain-containing protein [Amycolatopsis sp. NPDC059021]|uniref:EF-hand domain-containing protein n=1 Tax=Amycolatopsis sp. NPDC059021 TaxID=3346704 RepID=UPI00366D148C
MLSELQLKNLHSMFDVLDHDSNGLIERKDLIAVSDGVSEVFDHDEASPHRAAMTQAYGAWWEQIRAGADADGDDSVTRDEFVAAVDAGLLSDPAYLDVVAAAADTVFDAADVDGDGVLNQVEVVAVYSAAGASTAAAVGAFKQIDTNGDNRISREEWQNSVRGAFTSTGPDTPGSNMLGNAAN